MTSKDLPILGMTDEGELIMGGFFTAHDTHGYHVDWFLPMFLKQAICVSIPYFYCENLQHPNNDPDRVWPMLEIAYKEAGLPFDTASEKRKMEQYLKSKFAGSLQETALAIMREQEENGKAYQGWQDSLMKVV